MAEDDHLAYGDYHPRGQESEKSFASDTFRKLKQNQGLSSIFNKVHETVHGLGTEIGSALGQKPSSSHSQHGSSSSGSFSGNRFASFAAQRDGSNDVKWYVDGCGYMWAVSVALEQAKESIWILDSGWLTPELYLRRPPARNEQYRLDRMLLAAAKRGVKIKVVVYKEVTQALTRKLLNPVVPEYLHSLLPRNIDPVTSTLTKMGLAVTFKSLEHAEAENPLISPPLTVSSSHTKHALEDLHPNIAVFRHPDHLPDSQTLQSSFLSSLQNLSLSAATLTKLPGDALQAVYGIHEGVILYWAHHEKLCLIDGKTAFMGGLDLCYGRWDTNQHPIADCPGNLDDIVFPGQDFNNARVLDFNDVVHWENNKLDRKKSSRMGWSDVSISLHGPVVSDLRAHFIERWNFIYDDKYNVRKDDRYVRLDSHSYKNQHGGAAQDQASHGSYQPYRPPGSAQYDPQQYGSDNPYAPQHSGQESRQASSSRDASNEPAQSERGFGHSGGNTHQYFERFEEKGEELKEKLEGKMQHLTGQHGQYGGSDSAEPSRGPMACQIVRSAAKWSNGNLKTEASIQQAYIDIISRSQHFIYIENQFFITSTGDQQKPVKNKIGAAIVERILRAARAGEKYHMIVLMPAVPAFAGDLKDDAALGTRAILEFQYFSINRGGHSIMEEIEKAGFNPMEYIRFYNLRNYDRINIGDAIQKAEQESGVDYDMARREAEVRLDPIGYKAQEGRDQGHEFNNQDHYQKYQNVSPSSSRWDSVSECYMLGGEDIRKVPWTGSSPEIDAFVSEELYVHSKLLIADDRIVICGSANLNDRSQLGYHDSEIAIIIEDPQQIDSFMNGQPWKASKFAGTLRRQIFRKHLGLIPPQDMQKSDANCQPVGVPNSYDFGSPEDHLVTDPLADQFLNFWNTRARQNTNAFGQVFHPVPHDSVRTWKDYDEFYTKYFHEEEEEVEGKKVKKPAKHEIGHVVNSLFSPGEIGAREVKEILSTVKGTLVEMPLLFLDKEDIAQEGLGLNALTEDLYT